MIKGTTHSFCDWPGHISEIIFLGGCNFRCPTCHNAGIAFRPDATPDLDETAVFTRLRNRAKWLNGLVVSGGEPTIHPGLPDFLTRLHAAVGLPVKLDTNGSHPDMVLDLLKIGAIAAVSLDLKGPWAKYPELTGGRCTAAEAEENVGRLLDYAKARPGAILFRTTMVPGLTEDDINAVRGYAAWTEVVMQKYVPV